MPYQMGGGDSFPSQVSQREGAFTPCEQHWSAAVYAVTFLVRKTAIMKEKRNVRSFDPLFLFILWKALGSSHIACLPRNV